jgi:4-nitrophenyl phosphatase
VTSSQSVAATLAREFPDRGVVFVVGESGVISALRASGFKTITDPWDDAAVLAVVAGIDRSLTYLKLQRALTHIRAGARFYGTNPDTTFPTPAGLVPGAGSIIAALKAASGIDPVIIGKPAPYMFQLSAEQMRLAMPQILVVGDRLETDIAGGQAVGARTALVLSGVSSAAAAAAWRPAPDLVVPDLASLVGA